MMNGSTETIINGEKKSEDLVSGDAQSAIEMPHQTTSKRAKKLKEILNNGRYTKTTIKLVLYGLFLAYFVWATVYFVKNTHESLYNSTCSGYGFLLIVFCLVVFAVIYQNILKPHVLPSTKNGIWVPLSTKLGGVKYGSHIFFATFLVAAGAYLIYDTSDNRDRLIPLGGLIAFLLVGFVFSKHPTKVQWRTVGWGLVLQFVFGLLTIRWDVGRNIFGCIGDKVTALLSCANEGAAFVYGDFLVHDIKVFAFQALSTIFFLSFMINILYHYGIMQKVVVTIGDFLQWVMGTTVCESVNSAANIFLGQSEAPLLLSPYLKDLTASEIHAVITSGFATVSGTVLAAYISFGASAAHLITSSVMSAPAALCYSKLIYPEVEESKSTKKNIAVVKIEYDSVLDAASRGAFDAITLVMGIIANVIAFFSFMFMVNSVLTWMGILVGYTDESSYWTTELFVGKIFMPVSFLMGVPWEECERVGKLIGIKTMVNEFAAFSQMKQMTLSARTKVIATYAICGFSNPGSIGIMISILGQLMPNKREIVTQVIFRAFVSGAIVCFMTACIAAMLIPENMIEI